MQHPGALIPQVFNYAGEKRQADAIGLDLVRKFLRRSWRLWLFWVMAFVAVALAFIQFAPSSYTATTTIVIDEKLTRQASDNGPGVVDPAYVDTQTQVLQSREVYTRVLERARSGEFGDLGAQSLRMLLIRYGVLDADPQVAADRALVTSLKRGLLVRRVGASNAVDIAFTAGDPAAAAKGANAFAQEYLASEVDMKEAARQDLLATLSARLVELQTKAFAPEQADPVRAAPSADDPRARWRETQAVTEAYRALYNNTLQRRYAQSLEQPSPGARVITAAEAPESRSWPNTPLVLGLATFLGLVFGFAHTAWRFATDDVIWTADDLAAATGMTPHACAPQIARRNRRNIDVLGVDPPVRIISSTHLRDVMDRLAIRFCASARKRSTNVVAVVSTHSGAGASTLAAHLALSLASTGEKTALLDANWRRGRQGKSADASGLETLRGQLGDDPTAPAFVMLRTSGHVSEAAASRALVDMLGEVTPGHAWIVVDLNPLSCSADLDAIMTQLAFVVLVVGAGQTTGAALDHAATVIPGDKKVALVLNRASKNDVPRCG